MDSPVSIAVELATLRTNSVLANVVFFRYRLVFDNDLLFIPVIVVEKSLQIKPVIVFYY